jgi:hypothetical protein
MIPSVLEKVSYRTVVFILVLQRQMMVLERAGLLRREIKGRQHYCWIEPRPLREAEEWFEERLRF